MKDTIVTFKEKRFHSFLLDKTGLPFFVGNPTRGKDIRVFSCDDGVQEWLRPRFEDVTPAYAIDFLKTLKVPGTELYLTTN